MPYRNCNYSAFYVAEPFNPCGLGANATKDFLYYNMLRAWKGNDSSFPFNDAHARTYSVRDGSSWELTLKPRLHERLRNSKNIILFLSERTCNSRALREEIEYGVGVLGLPVIVVYPDYNYYWQIADSNRNIKYNIRNLWDKIPRFKELMQTVPTVHVPMSKNHITRALYDKDFTLQGKNYNFCWAYTD